MFFSGSQPDLTIYNTHLYEIIPGFIVGMIFAVIVTLIDKKPSDDVVEMFEKSKLPTEE